MDLEAKIDQLIVELAAVRAEVEALRRPSRRRILPLSKAYAELGYPNYAALWRQIGPNELYRPGIEAIDRRPKGAARPVWYVDIDKCLKRDEQLSAKRG